MAKNLPVCKQNYFLEYFVLRGSNLSFHATLDEIVYFYSDKYIGMMSRKSENLNKHQLAILANATLRVRLSPSFDLYSSVYYSQSKTGIYAGNYFMQKTYKNYGAKIGVTYYLNKRLTLNETTRASF